MVHRDDCPRSTLVDVEEKPFPTKVNTRPPYMLPCNGNMLCMNGKPSTFTFSLDDEYPIPFFKGTFSIWNSIGKKVKDLRVMILQTHKQR